MKYTGRITAALLMMVAVLFEIVHYAMAEGELYSYVSFAALVPFSYLGWWLGEQYDNVKYASVRDSLTYAFNRRYLHDAFPKLSAKAARGKKKLECCVLDVNDFKMINDTYGHAAGDVVLRNIAGALHQLYKDKGLVVRWGGDEFVIIAPALEENGKRKAPCIESALAELSVKMKKTITVSVGKALFPDDAGTLEELVRKADLNMYGMKQQVKISKSAQVG